MTWILHASDAHLGDIGAIPLDDAKEVFDAPADIRTTQKVFRHTLTTVSRFAEEHGKPDVVVFSGDLTVASHDSGFTEFRELLSEYTDLLPDDPSHIVVVPGNHDVAWDEKTGTPERYAGFLRATRDVGCTTPLIDGIDFSETNGVLVPKALKAPHVYDSPDVLVLPINTSNYCGVLTTPRNGWSLEKWEEELDAAGAKTNEILDQIKRLQQRDVPRVSEPQLVALSKLLEKLKIPHEREPSKLRIAVLHHHLLPVSVREERKAFESITNLGFVREALRAYGVDIVLHGHKHEGNVYWDNFSDPDELDRPESRMLVVSSPGHFGVGQPTMRAIMLEGPTTARNLRLVTFGGAVPPRKHPNVLSDQQIALWTGTMDAERPRSATITGPDPDAVYSRLRAFFERQGGETQHNLVCEMDSPTGALSIPSDYPAMDGADRERWFSELVAWWQLSDSDLVRREIVPFNHGHRIRRRWGDQLKRAAQILELRPDSSRAFVELVSPRETGRYADDERSLDDGTYPAFVVAQFTLRDGQLDCIAFFRKQEMQYWWPVNVAELAMLQQALLAELEETEASPGRITTVSTVALWKGRLPALAVPTVDLLMEEPARLWAMALAVARPDEATIQARDDWDQVLADLPDVKRRSRLGVDVLTRYIEGLATVAPKPELTSVATAMASLADQLQVLANTEELNTSAVDSINSRVLAVQEAVSKVLPK